MHVARSLGQNSTFRAEKNTWWVTWPNFSSNDNILIIGSGLTLSSLRLANYIPLLPSSLINPMSPGSRYNGMSEYAQSPYYRYGSNSTWLDSTRLDTFDVSSPCIWLCQASRRAQLDSLDTSSSTGATCNLVMITVIHLLFNKLFTD